MTVRMGVIGVGVMGSDHARLFAEQISGAELTAVYDADAARARAVADETGAKDVANSPEALIASSNVDAVLIASPDATHAGLTVACLHARKRVLCEKPLSPSAADCLDLIAEETKLGKRLIEVGFMRRYDPSYVAMRATRLAGDLGRALMLHCAHRNVSAPSWFTSDMAIANSAPHEFDIARFVLGAEIAEISVFQPESAGLVRPVFLVMRASNGALVDAEIHINAGYGYDVTGELVCERGTVSLTAASTSAINSALARKVAFPEDWRPRFADAYRRQNQAFVRAVAADRPTETGSSAYDGYAAQKIAEAGLAALASGRAVKIEMAERPTLYRGE